MRIFFLILTLFSLLACEDKQSSKKSNPTKTEVISETKKQIEKDTILKKEFPKLTDKNAMEFFLEYEKHNKENKVRIITDFGNIDIKLHNKTKFHRANFIYLTKRGYFDNSQFYRIVNNFIIQAGNSDEMRIAKKRRAIGRYLLPTDTKRGFKHHRGAVSMPSSEIENPYKLASPYEFFITQTNQYQLDGDYTIFGQVINGMNVVDEIAKQETDDSEWPLHNIYIKKVEIID